MSELSNRMQKLIEATKKYSSTNEAKNEQKKKSQIGIISGYIKRSESESME